MLKQKRDIQLLRALLPVHPKTKDRRTVLIRKMLSLTFILSKLSKPNKFDDIEVRLNNLTTAVSSIEESVSKLGRGYVRLRF